MKIAFFVNAYPMMSEAFISNSAAALIEAGHTVHIYGMGNVDPTGLSVPEVAPLQLEKSTTNIRWPTGQMARLTGLPAALAGLIRQHGAGSLLRLRPDIYRRTMTDLSAVYQAAQLPSDGEYDILHCQFATLAEHVIKHRKAGFLSGRLVVNFRGYDISELVVSRGEHLYDHVWPEADAFVSNCEFFRQRAISIGCPEDRITVVGSGLRLESFPYEPIRMASPERVRFLMVGRLIERKGFQIALPAIARYARTTGQPVQIDIVGDGPLRQHLTQLASDCGLGDAVSFHGAQSHAAIAKFIRKCDAFLAPSMTCPKGGQDAPVNTLKEAMAMGRPVIATRHGGIAELVVDGETGILCEENDIDSLAEGVRRLLAMQPAWQQMLTEARRAVEDTYALSRTTDALIEVYQSALTPPAFNPDDTIRFSKEAA